MGAVLLGLCYGVTAVIALVLAPCARTASVARALGRLASWGVGLAFALMVISTGFVLADPYSDHSSALSDLAVCMAVAVAILIAAWAAIISGRRTEQQRKEPPNSSRLREGRGSSAVDPGDGNT